MIIVIKYTCEYGPEENNTMYNQIYCGVTVYVNSVLCYIGTSQVTKFYGKAQILSNIMANSMLRNLTTMINVTLHQYGAVFQQ